VIARQPALATTLIERAHELAVKATGRHLDRRPDLRTRYPAAERRCIEDGEFHVRHLASALAMGRPELFEGYLIWTAQLLAGYGIDPEELVAHVGRLSPAVWWRPCDRLSGAGCCGEGR